MATGWAPRSSRRLSASSWERSSAERNFFPSPYLLAIAESLLDRLPELRRKLRDSLQNTQDQLATLPPPPPEDSASELLKLVTGFSADVGALVEGAQGNKQLLQQCRPAYKQFKRDIRKTAPRFVPFTAKEGGGSFVELMLEPEEPEEREGQVEDEILEMNLDAVGEHIEGWVYAHAPT